MSKAAGIGRNVQRLVVLRILRRISTAVPPRDLPSARGRRSSTAASRIADKGAIDRREDYHIMCGIAAVYDAAKIDGMKTSSQVARNFQPGSIAWAFVVNAAMVAGE